jgi:hypothetical protein
MSSPTPVQCGCGLKKVAIESFTVMKAKPRTGRRLKWVHAFAELERWKEEVLRVEQEIKRMGLWYLHKLNEHKMRALDPPHSDSWGDRGFHTLDNLLSQRWTKRWKELPDGKASGLKLYGAT